MNKEIKFKGHVTKSLQFMFDDGDKALDDYIESNSDSLDGAFVTLLYELLGGELNVGKSFGDTFEITIKKL